MHLWNGLFQLVTGTGGDLQATGADGGDDGVTVLCACTDLSRGDEVTFQYADDGNGRLLLDYGFAALHETQASSDQADGDERLENGLEYVGLEELDALLKAAPGETAVRLRL